MRRRRFRGGAGAGASAATGDDALTISSTRCAITAFTSLSHVLARLALRADVLDVTVARPDVDGSYRNATLVEARVVPEER